MTKKVFELMEEYSNSQFLVFSSGRLLFEGYRAVCRPWCLNMRVEHSVNFSNNTVVIFVY